MQSLHIKLESELMESIKNIASERQLSLTSFVKSLLRAEIEKSKEASPKPNDLTSTNVSNIQHSQQPNKLLSVQKTVYCANIETLILLRNIADALGHSDMKDAANRETKEIVANYKQLHGDGNLYGYFDEKNETANVK